MHRCLTIPEMRCSIIENFQGPCADLVAIALVQRAFYEPAMNKLWSKLKGLSPLIRCLPDDAYEFVYDRVPVREFLVT